MNPSAPNPVWRAALAALLSMLFGVLGLGGALYWFGEPGDLRTIQSLPLWALCAGFALLGGSFLCGGLRVLLLARTLGYPIRLPSAVRAHILGLFSAAVTPSGSGNAPAIALMLVRDGLQKTHAWAVAFYTGVVDVLFFVWAVPLAIFTLELFGSPLGVPGLLWWGLLLCPLLLGLWYALAFRLESTLALVSRLFNLRLLRPYQARMSRFLAGFGGSVVLLSSELTGKRAGVQLALQLLSAGVHLGVFCIFLVFAQSLGLHLSAPATLALFLLVFVASFLVPTPGGSGFLEFALLWLIAAQSEAALVAPALLLWRVVSFYSVFLFGPLLGGAALLKRVGAPPPTPEAISKPTPKAGDD